MKPDVEIERALSVFTTEPDYLHLKFTVPQEDDADNTREAEIIRDKCLAIFNANPGKVFKVITDTTELAGRGYVSKGAREIYKDLVKHPQIGKVAIVGETDFQTAVLEFVLFLIHTFNKRISWFKSKEEAMMWLEQK